MLNNELKRNGSGYYNGTPYNAVLCNPEAGDVYETGMNKIYLILKNHGKFSIALALFSSLNPTNNTTHEIMVDESGGSRRYYTTPAMLQYVFNDIFKNRVGTLDQDIFLGLMEIVGDNLGVSVKVSKEPTDGQARLIDELIQENEVLKVKLEYLKHLENTNRDEAIYKRMYYELLDRIIGKGGVSGEH